MRAAGGCDDRTTIWRKREDEGEIGGVNRRKANARWNRGWGAY